MSIYNTGTVQVKVGSAAVKGETGVENFLTYVSAGYLFKIESEGTWYQIAAIQNASNFTLTSRYDNTNYRTSRAGEHIATVTIATKMYSGTVDNTPVMQNYFTINASIENFSDDGAGILTGNASPAGSGTINYDTGAWTITLGTDVTATVNTTASYLSGNTRSGMTYQIVTDYTTNYSFPEMSVNDTNFQYIYTKAIRMIDSNLNNIKSDTASINSATINKVSGTHIKYTTASLTTASINQLNSYNASANYVTIGNKLEVTNYIRMGTNKYIFSGNRGFSASIIADATSLVSTPIKGSLYMGKVDIWKFNSDTTATKL